MLWGHLPLTKRKWIFTQSAIALCYTVTVYIQFQHLTILNTTLQTSIFFLPAAVRVFSVMLFGYWAGLGIAVGTLIHDVIFNVAGITFLEMIIMAAEQGLVVSSSLFVWALYSSKVSGLRAPEIDFVRIDALDVLAMCCIQALINSTAGHIYYAWSPTIHQQFDPYYYAVMLVGDVTGAFFVFITANLVFSGLLRAGVISRKRFEDGIDQRTSVA